MKTRTPRRRSGAARSGRDIEDDDTVTLSQTADPDKDTRACRGCGVRAGALVRALRRPRPPAVTATRAGRAASSRLVLAASAVSLGFGDWHRVPALRVRGLRAQGARAPRGRVERHEAGAHD